MGMTLGEAILARASGRTPVSPGDLVQARVDLVLGNDVTMPLAIEAFRRMGAKQVFDRDRVVLVCDHFAPAPTVQAAAQLKLMRQFAQEQELTNYYEVGSGLAGVEHALLPEEGLILPGTLVVGADSHTITYGAFGAFGCGFGSSDVAAAMALGEVWLRVPPTTKLVYRGQIRPWVSAKDLILHTLGRLTSRGAIYQALEFAGPVIEGLSVEGRLTLCNMAVEAGAKVGLVTPDHKVFDYLASRSSASVEPVFGDSEARYLRTVDIQVDDLEPQVALPPSPDRVVPVSRVAGLHIDAVIIGSCTNGRIEDLRSAAQLLEGRHVAQEVRAIIIPATQRIYLQALEEGLVKIFLQAGAAVSVPTCGPCFGGHMGLLTAGERAVSTTNRNFIGRMGDPQSEVYLASPAVAAASAVRGRITLPEEVL